MTATDAAVPAVTPPAVRATPAPDPAPAILSATTSSTVVHAGETVVWTVRTTAGVVSVAASTPIYKLDLPRTAPGVFQGSLTVPAAAPGFFHGAYSLAIVATDGEGRTATSAIALTFE